jgi:hypothetical protein
VIAKRGDRNRGVTPTRDAAQLGQDGHLGRHPRLEFGTQLGPNPSIVGGRCSQLGGVDAGLGGVALDFAGARGGQGDGLGLRQRLVQRQRLGLAQLGMRQAHLLADRRQHVIEEQAAIEAVADPVHQHAAGAAQGAAVGHQAGVITHPGEQIRDLEADLVEHERLEVEAVTGEVGERGLEGAAEAFEVGGGLAKFGFGGGLGEDELLSTRGEEDEP